MPCCCFCRLALLAPPSPGLFLPASAFKAVRREAAEALLSARLQHGYADGIAEQPVLPQLLAQATAAAHTPDAPATVEQMEERRAAGAAASSSDNGARAAISAGAAAERAATQHTATLRVLCRTRGQVDAALALRWLPEVILDFLEVHGLREAVAAVQAAGKRAVVAAPRILMPDEDRLLLFYLKLNADALLLRGAGALQQLVALGGPGAVVPERMLLGSLNGSSPGDGADSSLGAAAATASAAASSSSSSGGERMVTVPQVEGDFSLNAANVLAADLLISQGLSRLCPTHDLNASQLAALARGLGPARSSSLEVVVHQHLPIFHTAHCVFCRFLSEGNSFKDCAYCFSSIPLSCHAVCLPLHALHTVLLSA